MSDSPIYKTRWLSRIQTRLRRARPGSVLILCVALLVLLALIGTALISTARTDRYSAAQHTNNTEVDLLMEGVKDLVTGVLTNDLFDIRGTVAPTFRPADTDLVAASTYVNRDAPRTDSEVIDAFLASRVPQPQNLGAPWAIANPALWPTITRPLIPSVFPVGSASPTVYCFAQPYQAAPATPVVFTTHQDLIPDVLPINGTNYPAFRFVPGGPLYMAADADGDGIADAGLVELPGGDINGVRYYYAARIIDNNSAVNVNTAWSRNFDFTGAFDRTAAPAAGAVENYGFFRSNVGLLEMLKDYGPAGVAGAAPTTTNPGTSAEMYTGPRSVNAIRWSGQDKAYLNVRAIDPTTGNGVDRNDFNFASQGDAMESQLARSLDKPGINRNGSNYFEFAAFSLSDTAALVPGFCVRDPTASLSQLELSMPLSLGSPVPVPYKPGDVLNWYAQNFDFDSAAAKMPIRTLITTRNPLSNLVLVPIGPYDWNGDAYTSAAISRNDPLMPPFFTPMSSANPWMPSPTYVVNGAIGMPAYTAGSGGKAPVVAKTNVNVAPFEELWRAFWSVMASKIPAGITPAQPPNGTQPPLASLTGATGAVPRPVGMFRSASRDSRTIGAVDNPAPLAQLRFTPTDMLTIRSALAAVNAMDLRDSDDDVTSREIPVYDFTTQPGTAGNMAPKFRVRVFGNERQPFITEVYVNTFNAALVGGEFTGAVAGQQNPNGYVAIELHNPYSVPMVLTHWALGLVSRDKTIFPLTITPLTAGVMPPSATAQISNVLAPMGYPPTQPAAPNTGYYGADPQAASYLGGGQIIIPADGYVVLENYPPGGGTLNPSDATYRPPEAFTNVNMNMLSVYVPNLTDAIPAGVASPQDIVLFRPRRGDGILTAVTATEVTADPRMANNIYHEQLASELPNLLDMIPVDSYDFTDLIQSGLAGPWPIWHYVRASGPGAAWKFVFPGLYHAGGAGPRQDITNIASTAAGSPFATDTVTPTALGDSDAVSSYPTENTFPGVQLQNQDWGANSTYNRTFFPAVPTGAPTVFPFGGFARNGDMLQIPFMGAYQVLDPAFDDTAPAWTTCYEMTPITMDCSFIDDAQRTEDRTKASESTRAVGGDPLGDNAAEDALEQLGRFCPINAGPSPTAVNDFDTSTNGTYQGGVGVWRYHFATSLFDYLTVQAPSDDYSPNVDPATNDRTSLGVLPVPFNTRYPGPTPLAVKNTTSVDASDRKAGALPYGTYGKENRVGVEGLININTAPWYVLAQLPLLPNDAAGPIQSNGIPIGIENLAKAIVVYRDGVPTAGVAPLPFRSLFDLNNVPAVKLAQAAAGSWDTSLLPAASQVPGDFEDQYRLVTRISNLATTRSDSFTVYLLVQGWRNAGTTTPELVAQRRAVMLLDRSGMTPESGVQPKRTVINAN